jgi:hypothetical protein
LCIKFNVGTDFSQSTSVFYFSLSFHQCLFLEHH